MPCLKDCPELLQLQELIRKKPVAIYLVGGAPRDLLLGRQGRDFDFAVSQDAIPLARAFARKIKGAFVLLDAETGCARVAKKKDGQLWTFDLADFRAPTFRRDLKKRDFTINTLAVNFRHLTDAEQISAKIIPDKKAKADLKARVLRMVSAKAFVDDPLRLLRAYSLMAQLGFKIDPATQKAIRAQVKLIAKASPERVREEFFKILESPRAAATLKAMYKDGILFEVIPQLRVMEKVHQGGYHHLDVWRHSLEMVSQLE
ncbi:MAG: CCA tRNA nucleotidyltransferase, partial [Candidatus Omnitrophica bacterium]|nr:CCA tRNA nucleotidyltransferase [Candidatus Omnitrophota bacterium]